MQDDWRQQVPVLVPEYNQTRLQQVGLTKVEVNQTLTRLLTGAVIGSYIEGDDVLPIVVRAPENERLADRAVESVPVYSPLAKSSLPFGELIVAMDVQWQDAILRRINRQPTIMVQADPAPGELTGEVFTQVRKDIEAITLPPGYRLTWYGEYKASNDANAGLAASAPFGFAAMVIAVVFMFNAIRQPLVIWLTVPLALIGVVIGLVLFNTPFEFMAILGFLSLIGMMVKNAIVLVDQADNEIRQGSPPLTGLIQASVSRARPVVLGALTTILGVAPLMTDPFFKSMAVTIMFGLLFATLLTLLVVPLLYAALLGIKSTDAEQAQGAR